jgi:UDP:flavonoid glycosyltransferase YjiC (YdhE family)
MPDCDFMIATGTPQTAKEAQEELPLNVTLASHIPQLSLLPEASAFIMHGGLGSLKEAICCGVPTLVMPMVFDQPYNAMRVRELSLGMALYPDKVSALAIESCLSTLLNDARIKDGLCQMQEVFLAEAAKKPIVSMLLAQLAALS